MEAALKTSSLLLEESSLGLKTDAEQTFTLSSTSSVKNAAGCFHQQWIDAVTKVRTK